VVVGDTPRDVEAAQLGGAGLVAVASGVHGADELLAAGAPRVFDDLTATAEVLAYLFST
jgi:phosphoglycolate phosphatase-like HAD superfamily hydrolase